jgi:hypothetical protein
MLLRSGNVSRLNELRKTKMSRLGENKDVMIYFFLVI